jgi:GT2 family glycosyltransferase
MNLTVSIVLYKTSEIELNKVIKCIFNNSNEIKLYLIDNSPKDNLRKFGDLDHRIKYIFNNKNVGYGVAHNIALKKAINEGVKYHLVLNSDIEFNNSVFSELSSYLDKNNDVGHVMPKITYPNGELQYLCKLIPTPLDLILRRFIPRFLYQRQRIKYQLEFTNYSKAMEVPYLSGCFMFLRVNALKEVGLFDERFFMYPEDVDLTRRINDKFKTIFYPNVSVIHNHAKDSYKSFKMLKIHTINMIKYFNKWGWFFDKKRKIANMRILKQLKKNE